MEPLSTRQLINFHLVLLLHLHALFTLSSVLPGAGLREALERADADSDPPPVPSVRARVSSILSPSPPCCPQLSWGECWALLLGEVLIIRVLK